jgi:hypothetical protein
VARKGDATSLQSVRERCGGVDVMPSILLDSWMVIDEMLH